MFRRFSRRDFLGSAVFAAASPIFEVKALRGVNFLLQNSPTTHKYLIETMPGGVALLDYNNDGLLDIFFVNGGKIAGALRAPENFERNDPRYWNRLYRQNRDGSFTDVTQAAGLGNAGSGNYGMGVAIGDYDNDGYPDIYVTNYGKNILYHNNGDGTFKECALEAGLALTAEGKGLSGMGTVFQDYDNDGRPDVLVTVLPRELYALYHNDGDGSFTYKSLEAGLGTLTSGSSGWGVGFEDFDNDGWKDLFVAQSHVLDNVEKIDASLRYKELPLLALNHQGRFERADSGITTPLAARGAAFGDINNDGWIDVVVSTLGGPPVLLLNRGGGDNHWLSITLRGTRSNRDGYGARVSVNGQIRFASSAGSYICANDKRLHFGLGSTEKASVEVLWPSGAKQLLNDVRANQFLEVREPERP